MSSLLCVTIGEQRLANVRREMQDLPAEFAKFYRFTTYDRAMGDFLGQVWKSRLLTDTALYPLVAVKETDNGTREHRTG